MAVILTVPLAVDKVSLAPLGRRETVFVTTGAEGRVTLVLAAPVSVGTPEETLAMTLPAPGTPVLAVECATSHVPGTALEMAPYFIWLTESHALPILLVTRLALFLASMSQ